MKDLLVPVPNGHINAWHRPASPGSPTAVLIHGLTGTSRWMSRVINHLPADMGVISLDVRGRGQSWQAPPPYDLATIADDVARSLDHLDLEAAIVAGYSMGAWVAGMFAQRHTHRTHRIVLLDGGLPIELDRSRDPKEILDDVVGPSMARLEMSFDSPEAYYDFWRRHPALEAVWDPAMEDILSYDLHQVDNAWRVRANPDAIIESGGGFALDPEVNEAAAKTPLPATLVYVDHGLVGEPGGFIPQETAEAAAATNPNIGLLLLKGLNHYTLVFGDGASVVASVVASE
ncbi:MAG: alpha/beta fold hydrolase [Acidimicrobiia bacterium]